MREIVAGRIYTQDSPVRFAGGTLNTRMTVMKLARGVVLHCPVPIDAGLRAEIAQLGEVTAILAPSNVHHLFLADAQRAFPDVPTYAVAGLIKKRRDLTLLPLSDDIFTDELDRVFIGNPVMHEIVLLDRESRTVIAVDLVEHIGDATPGMNRVMRAYIKMMFMWNKPRPAPELRMMTFDRASARLAIEKILSWDFDRMVIAHGELFDTGAKDALREAWRFVHAHG
ncbi:MAG TPA: hypothetical protein VGO62_12045 [Myxococcota bacterium]|jgi:hypothetical protein